jgi:hypothetical protein
MPIQTYRRKGEVQAVQWTGDNADDIGEFCHTNAVVEDNGRVLVVRSLALIRYWWVVRGRNGLMVLSNKEFEEQYEPSTPLPADELVAERAAADALLVAAQEVFSAMGAVGFAAVKKDSVRMCNAERRLLDCITTYQTARKQP